ncbi:hypothetical protein HDV00_007724 [Rhizophlyctis rosea]|nr:hypothetical protein HDV00_007724 [Rhizophlyctis rosea]
MHLKAAKGLRSTCKAFRALISVKDIIWAEAGRKLKVHWYRSFFHVDDPFQNCFRWATVHGHAEVLRSLIPSLPPSTRQNRLNLLLMDLAEKGHIEAVNVALDMGADATFTDDDGDCALNCAARVGPVEIVQALLKAGAKQHMINLADHQLKHYERGPLYIAAGADHPDIVKVLLEAGAHEHLRDGATLVEASFWGFLDIIELLLAAGADVNAEELDEDEDEPSLPICEAAGEGHLEAVKLLLSAGASIDSPDPSRYPGLLIRAAEMGHLEVVNHLLELGADVHARGNEALLNATTEGYVEVVRALVAAGVDVNAQDTDDNGHPNGRTALIEAVEAGHIAVIEALLELGADVHFGGDLALRSALRCRYGYTRDDEQLQVIQILMGALPDPKLLRPTWDYIPYNNHHLTEALLRGGAAYDLEDLSFWKVAGLGGIPKGVVQHWHRGTRFIGSLEFIEDHTALVRAVVEPHHTELLKVLLSAGLDISGETGEEALWEACRRNRPEAVKLLLDAGADMNAGNPEWDMEGKAFRVAIDNRNIDIVKMFMERGVNRFLFGSMEVVAGDESESSEEEEEEDEDLTEEELMERIERKNQEEERKMEEGRRKQEEEERREQWKKELLKVIEATPFSQLGLLQSIDGGEGASANMGMWELEKRDFNVPEDVMEEGMKARADAAKHKAAAAKRKATAEAAKAKKKADAEKRKARAQAAKEAKQKKKEDGGN